MIDLKYELQNYQPINVKDILENSPNVPDNIKNSMILYNKALESLRTGSEDIAIIELKKAVSMNPNFFEAVNLLGICYSYIKDYPKAAEMFERVAAAESNGVKAMAYLKLINTGAEFPEPPKKRTREAAKERVVKEKIVKEFEPSHKSDLLKIAAGVVAGALIMLLVILPLSSGSGDGSAGDKEKQDENIKLLQQEIASYESKYKAIEEQYKSLQSDLDTANSNIDYYKSQAKLYQAENLTIKKDYEAAADMLILMKTFDFRGEDKEKFDKLYGDTMPAAAKKVYEEGFKLFNSKKYQEALSKFTKVEVYTDSFERVDAMLYYMGKCYTELNDTRNAMAAYQRIRDTYPKSKYSAYAGYRIEELKNLQ